MNGIMALKRGGKANIKSAKEKKVAKARYNRVKKAGEAARAEYNRDRARSNQGNNQNNEEENRISQAEETRNRLLKEAEDARNKGEKYVIDTELFTRNKAGISNADPTGKLREGMTGAEYHDFMRQLHGANPAAMQKAFPWSSGKALGNIAKMAIPAPIRWGLGALKKAGQDVGKDLAGIFGLDGLNSKLVNIAGGGDNKQYNDIIKGQQAYDPSGLEGYKDKIYRDLFKQVNKNTLGPYGDPNPAFGTDQLDIFDIPLNDEVDESYGNTVYNPAFGEYDLRNAEKGHNYNVGKPISMGALDTEEPLSITYDENINERWKKLFPNVSETKYKKPEDVITQENISTDLLTPINQPEQIGVYTDGTPMYANVGEFDEDSLDILNSLGQADGGYMSNFPNQKMGTQSLTASDNIDDRIMKNLQFEKMAPGMMGYNQGGKVMSTFEKLKAIADNNYG